MGYQHIDCPCKNCPNVREACHSTCKKYHRYEFLCSVERNYNKKEAQTARAIREITINGINNRAKNSEPLKHGRKTR